MKIVYYLLTVAAIGIVAGCSKLPTHDYNKIKANVQVNSAQIDFTVSDEKVETRAVTETAGGLWSAVADKDWIKVSRNIDGFPAHGTGSADLLIKVASNDETFTEGRKGNIVITAEGDEPASIVVLATIPVSQAYLAKGQAILGWSITPADSTSWNAADTDEAWKEISVSPPAPATTSDTLLTISIKGSAAAAFKIKDKLDPYTYNKLAAQGNKIEVSTISKNEGEQPREAFLVVKNKKEQVVAVSKLVQQKD
ncbi:MAG: hypothetical protein LBD59_03340 [Prevotellaceae bacterium]|jgi:hypothetical protein|nr:hypothetical protein [Prevotellaceae bacterium]